MHRTVKHLLYYIWPTKHTDVWRWNVSQLLRRMSTFNGRKIVAVATDDRSHSMSEVKRAFGNTIDDYINIRNDPVLGEVAAFEDLLHRVESVDPSHIAFYMHAKGVKYTPQQNKNIKTHSWTELMYSTLLDYPAMVEDALKHKGIVGTFMKHGNAFGSLPPSWHYAGTFFAFRCDAIFGRDNWRYIPRQWWGTEVWPSLVFPNNQDAASLLLEGNAPEMQLYFNKYWHSTVNAAWRTFQERHATLKRNHTYAEVISTLKLLGHKRILVTGPQRSGTTIASKMLARDLGLPCIDEFAFGVHSFDQFYAMAKDKPAYVMQCPAMSAQAHLVPGTMVIWMRRNIQDVLRSQNRVGWGTFEVLEKDKYFYGGNQEAAAVKTEAWNRYQRISLGERAMDLDYESLQGHPMWIDDERRRNFNCKQTSLAE